jgi:hypothetical protein
VAGLRARRHHLSGTTALETFNFAIGLKGGCLASSQPAIR